MQRAHKVYQCQYCNKFFIEQPKKKRHSKQCSGILEIVYNFNNQNLISYQDLTLRAMSLLLYTLTLKLLLQLLSLQIQDKKNVCCFICDDSGFSSKVKFRSHNNSKELCTFSCTTYNLKLFYQRTTFFCRFEFNMNVERYGF